MTVEQLEQLFNLIAQTLVLKMPLLMLIAGGLFFVVATVVLFYHWKQYGHDFIAFYLVAIIYTVGASWLVWKILNYSLLALQY